MPLVTVLMAVYNGEKYLAEAIDSILQQTFSDFEFLIIDDASIDNSVAIISSYQDNRIQVISNKENLGLTKSLNKGIKLARGKYIARMDADDISLPHRLAKQLSFMEAHPEIGVCGTAFELFGSHSRVIKHKTTHQDIITYMLWKNGIAHPTAVIRKSIIEKYQLFYDESYVAAQDYNLWVRFAKVTHLANLPEVLLKYRIHDKQVSRAKLRTQNIFAFQAKELLLTNTLDCTLPEQAVRAWRSIAIRDEPLSIREFDTLVKLFSYMVRSNASNKWFNQELLKQILSDYIHIGIQQMKFLPLVGLKALFFPPFRSYFSTHEKIKIIKDKLFR